MKGHAPSLKGERAVLRSAVMVTTRWAALGCGVSLWSCLACSDELPPEAYDYANIFGTAGYERKCGFATDEIALDEATPVGFRANDVIDWVAGEHRSTLTWGATLDAQRAPATSDITFSVEPLGKARWVEGAIENPWGFEVYCGADLLLDVHLTVSTSDGSFDESLDTALVFKSVDVGLTQVLLASTPPAAASDPAAPASAASSDGPLRLSLTLSPYAAFGHIDSGEASGSQLAVFPASNDCPYFEVPVGDIPTLSARSRAQAVDRLNAASPALVQPGGATLSLGFEDAGGGACAEIDLFGITRFSFPGAATLKSSDGQIDGRFAVELQGDAGDSDFQSAMASARVYLEDPARAATTAASFGITPAIDFAPYPAQSVHFLHEVSGGSVDGWLLAVGGLVPPPCEVRPDDLDLALCEGDQELFAARWSTPPPPP
jgi:hypothetical protein